MLGGKDNDNCIDISTEGTTRPRAPMELCNPLQDSSWLPDRNMTIYCGSYRLPLLDFVIGICCQFDFCGVHFE